MKPRYCLVLAIVLSVVLPAFAGCSTKWYGTAPFCDGSCPNRCEQLARSKSGDGGSCWSGTKVQCRCSTPSGPDESSCIPTETSTKCYGVVLVCTNIQRTGNPQVPTRTCSRYACGICAGFPFIDDDGNNATAHVKIPTAYSADLPVRDEDNIAKDDNMPCEGQSCYSPYWVCGGMCGCYKDTPYSGHCTFPANTF